MFDLITLACFFVLGVIGWFFYKVYIFPYYISPLRNIPGPPSDNLIFGNIGTMIMKEVNIVFSVACFNCPQSLSI
jgi:hypothetical protein